MCFFQIVGGSMGGRDSGLQALQKVGAPVANPQKKTVMQRMAMICLMAFVMYKG